MGDYSWKFWDNICKEIKVGQSYKFVNGMNTGVTFVIASDFERLSGYIYDNTYKVTCLDIYVDYVSVLDIYKYCARIY